MTPASPPGATCPPPELPQDAEHLRMLSICQYVWGGLHVVFGCLGIAWPLVFAEIFRKLPKPPSGAPNQPPPEFFENLITLYTVLGVGFGSLAILTSLLALLTGRALAARRSRRLCLVTSGIQCAFAPLGTVLGVFTILVLTRESVRRVFGARG